jgi:homopolymeric O-antigen transport system ATP-binding protein
MAELAVRAAGVGKEYRLGEHTGYQLLTEVLSERVRALGRRRPPRERLWALRDVNFEVPRGETFGIIGHNGAGKSTLLKVLSRVTPPTEGSIELHGRVGALLEIGTGFHPELTGRENIFLNGAILGMGRAEIRAKFDEIVDFAEVRRFIDTPVKRYSSGMYLRLAFAVAAHLEPEILIVDEVLSVGDLAFQEKCLGRMERVADEGRTVLFVSHNLAAVRKLCPRSMLLAHGRKVTEGPTEAVLESYVSTVRADAAIGLRERADREGNGRYRFTSIRFESRGETVDAPLSGRDLDVVLRYESEGGDRVRNATFAVAFYSVLGVHILHVQSDVAGTAFRELPPEGEVRCRLPRLPLPAGRYALNVFGTAAGDVADWVQRACELTVIEGDFYGSGRLPPQGSQTVLVDQQWELHEPDAPADALARASGSAR